jgi:hypothetical protein
MSTSTTPKKALKNFIRQTILPIQSDGSLTSAIKEMDITFGEYSDGCMHYIQQASAVYNGENLSLYDACIDKIASCIIERFVAAGEKKQRIPMLPELQKAIEKRGYSFTLLRGTSYLCEVQISAK